MSTRLVGILWSMCVHMNQNECHKTKTKPITLNWPITKDTHNPVNQSMHGKMSVNESFWLQFYF